MADSPDSKTGLAGVAAAAKQAPGRGLPPVHLWHPKHCGEIDIVIQRDGVWMHEGSPIGRAGLVRLFSTVLRKDTDGYVLVTPGEKLSITVEDLPFRAVAVEPSPSVHVRADLWARIARPVFYELVEMAEVEDGRLTVRSGDESFALGPVGAGVE